MLYSIVCIELFCLIWSYEKFFRFQVFIFWHMSKIKKIFSNRKWIVPIYKFQIWGLRNLCHLKTQWPWNTLFLKILRVIRIIFPSYIHGCAKDKSEKHFYSGWAVVIWDKNGYIINKARLSYAQNSMYSDKSFVGQQKLLRGSPTGHTLAILALCVTRCY